MVYGQLNQHFDFYNQTNEQDFYADFIDEDIRLSGTECLYIPKTFDAIDKLLGEPYKVLYDRFFPIPCRLANPMGYGGANDIMSEFGLKTNLTSEWIISKRIFRKLRHY